MRRRTMVGLMAVALAVAGCGNNASQPGPSASASASTSYTVVGKIGHDRSSFTQGLEVMEPGMLVESSGQFGRSKVTMYSTDGVAKISQSLPAEQFAEGITQVGDRFIQLTWKDQVAHTWSATDLTPGPDLKYSGEGWGLCYDEAAKVVWRSDGSSKLTAHDPDDFHVLKTVKVAEAGKPVEELNELECVDGKVWANVWKSPRVVQIDPGTGAVTKAVDFSELVAKAQADQGATFGPDQVLNGLAYDEANDQWYVAGKEWANTYVVKIA